MGDSIWTILTSIASATADAGVWEFFHFPFAEKSWFSRAYNWLVSSLTDPKRFLQFSFGILVLGLWIIWWRKK